MNFRLLPYKQRNLYLLIGGIFFLLIAYFVTIEKTISLYTRIKVISGSVVKGESASLNLIQTKKKLNNLEKYLSIYMLDSIRNQQYIMSEVSGLCKSLDITLRNFPKAIVLSQNDFDIVTNVIETEGSFVNQLKLIYSLETKHKIGRVSSVTFKTYTDNKSKKPVLSLTMYLQNVKTSRDVEKL